MSFLVWMSLKVSQRLSQIHNCLLKCLLPGSRRTLEMQNSLCAFCLRSWRASHCSETWRVKSLRWPWMCPFIFLFYVVNFYSVATSIKSSGTPPWTCQTSSESCRWLCWFFFFVISLMFLTTLDRYISTKVGLWLLILTTEYSSSSTQPSTLDPQ